MTDINAAGGWVRYILCRILTSNTYFLRIPYAVFVWLGVRNSVLFAQELLLSSADSERSLLGRMTDGFGSGAKRETPIPASGCAL
ncbi:hypothetical protein N8306_02845 [Yoonia sp.]|nr:hypothetical protein [Yoonia sp.]